MKEEEGGSCLASRDMIMMLSMEISTETAHLLEVSSRNSCGSPAANELHLPKTSNGTLFEASP